MAPSDRNIGTRLGDVITIDWLKKFRWDLMTEWEREFVDSLKKQRSRGWSKRQLDVLEKIWRKYWSNQEMPK